jgi:thiol:disulfide interchange protein DsbC
MMKRLLMIIAAPTAVTAARADDAAARATLQRAFPRSPIQGISKTPIPGVLEAAIEDQVFDITEDGRYIFGGPLLDVKADRNLTEARLEQINAIPFDSLPLEWAIKRSRAVARAGSPSSRIPTVRTARCWSRRLRAWTT